MGGSSASTPKNTATAAAEMEGLFDEMSVETAEELFSRDQSKGVVVLSKGEKMGFAEFGSSTGIPVLFIPGVDVGRMFGAIFHQVAKQNNIRILSLDRPGFGLSDDHDEKPRTKEFSRRLREFAVKLGIPKFHLMGHSTGGTYAMTASVYLKDLVQEPLILLAPWVNPKTNQGSKLTVRFAANYLPSSLLSFGSKVNGSMLGLFSSSLPTMMKFRMSERERRSVKNDSGARMLKLLAKSLGEGHNTGMPKDILVCLERNGGCGFQVEDLQKRMIIYHGTVDDTVPFAAIQSFDKRTGDNISLRVVEKGTHNLCLDAAVINGALAAIAK